MVALFIFAMTGTAILKAASDHLAGVGQIEEINLATWVANNRLNEMLINRSWPLKNNEKGNVKMADRTWYWKQTVTKTSDDNLKLVAISVGLDPDYKSTITSVSTYLSSAGATSS
jgi:general secretion pathway protein I